MKFKLYIFLIGTLFLNVILASIIDKCGDLELCCLNTWFVKTFALLCKCELNKRKNEKEDANSCFENGLKIYIIGELHHSQENLHRLINLVISNKINLFIETPYFSREAEKYGNPYSIFQISRPCKHVDEEWYNIWT